MTDPSQHPLVLFYEGRAPGPRGLSFHEVLAFSDDQMERAHDYIQWLFPLPVPPHFQPQVPLLVPEVAKALREDSETWNRVQAAIGRYISFLAATEHWRVPRDHNHLRISRVIKFLRHMGVYRDAQDFLAFCENLCPQVNPDSLRFWRGALEEGAMVPEGMIQT